jgi:hypothetical protein
VEIGGIKKLNHKKNDKQLHQNSLAEPFEEQGKQHH